MNIKVGDDFRIKGHLNWDDGRPNSDGSWVGEKMTIKAIAAPFILVEETAMIEKWGACSGLSDDLVLNLDHLDFTVNGVPKENVNPYRNNNVAIGLHSLNEFNIGDTIISRHGGTYEMSKVVAISSKDGGKSLNRIKLLKLAYWETFMLGKDCCYEYIENKSRWENGYHCLGISMDDKNITMNRWYRLPFQFAMTMVNRMEQMESRNPKAKDLLFKLYPEINICCFRCFGCRYPNLKKWEDIVREIQERQQQVNEELQRKAMVYRAERAEQQLRDAEAALDRASIAYEKARMEFEATRIPLPPLDGYKITPKCKCEICTGKVRLFPR